MNWTGVGSRDTPYKYWRQMRLLAKRLAELGYCLRSGKADGADAVFQEGVQLVGKDARAEIYKPWKSFNTHVNGDSYTLESGLVVKSWWDIDATKLPKFKEAEDIASEIHPAWSRLKQGARSLHTRNVFQVLGPNLDHPSDFLVCYAPSQSQSVKGGTRTAYELAKLYNIPCFNYATQSHEEITLGIKEIILG